MSDLSGRVALVTGGGSGIGLASARALADAGARVALMGRSPERLAQAQATLGDARAAVFPGDVAVEAQVERCVAGVMERFGRLDVAVACAGTGTLGGVLGQPTDEWTRTLQTNLDGTMFTLRHAAAAMVRGGRGGSIVAISSIAGVLTHRLMSAYCVSKAAVEMLVRCAADELGAQRIRVNAIRPGIVPTDLALPLTSSPAVLENYRSLMPLGREGTPEEVAQAVLFLASDASSWTTGQLLAVDGGHTLRMGPDVALMFR